MLDRDNNERPHRRTALIAKELSRYNIDIAALSETRLAEEGSLTEIGSGYTYFWKGKAQNEDRIHGVGFAIKNSILKNFPNLPTGINERLMKLRFPISDKRFATIISAYAPTLTSSDDVKEQFYAELDNILKSTPSSDKLILLGDFNARVGRDHEQWNGVIGRHGVGKMNSNGLLLLSKCAEHNLVITNTTFRLADKFKTTWMHPRSKQWHLIDYIITRQCDTKDVHSSRAMRGADCWTDHRLVRAKFNLHIMPLQAKRQKVIKATFNTELLQSPTYHRNFQISLEEKLEQVGRLSGGSNDKWNQFKDIVTETAKSVLGPKKKIHQDWFDEHDNEIQKLLEKKHAAFNDWQNFTNCTARRDKFKYYQAKAQKEIRAMQDRWWDRKADELQSFADNNNYKKFFSATKAIYGPTKGASAPLLSADGTTIIKDKEGINARWLEHYSQLLNRPSSVNEEALRQIPQRPTVYELDQPPTKDELQKAINQMNSGKAPGKDGIPAEVYKALGITALEVFHDILLTIWDTEAMPAELRDATIVTLYKNKGSKSDCGNYRGISLLSIAGKILARILLNRLIANISENCLPEAQCGFRSGRSTIDMVFAIRQIQEKCIEQRMGLYAVFIDLTKAFDTVNREALWTILSKLGCPAKFTTLIQLFHEDMTGQVLSNGEYTDSFNISNGVKQGCCLAPVLFNLYFTQVLTHAVKDLDIGIYIKYRTDGSLFDLRRLNARTKTIEKLILDALFADDCALMAHTEDHLQTILNCFADASKLFGLTISLGKTEVLVQAAPNTVKPNPVITIDNTQLTCVDNFKYLGSNISSDGSLDKEITSRIQKACQALGKLRVKVLQRHSISLSTKIKLFKAIVLTSLLYGCESWTPYRRHIKKLEQFTTRSLRTIMGIRWQDKVTNQEILDRAKMSSIESLLIKSQLRWTGHVIRMEDHRMPKQLLFGALKEGSRQQGRPKLRYKDTLKSSLKWCEIKPQELGKAASDRSRWRYLTNKATKAFEADRKLRLAAAREKRHSTTTPTVRSQDHCCTVCGRLCASSFGLRSHMRSHR